MDKNYELEYSNLPKNYWWTKGRTHLLRELLEKINLKNGGKYLEVGCGHGINSEILAEYGHYYGLDVSEGILTYFKNDYEKIKGTAEELPFKNGSFDSVFLMDILEHLDNDTSAYNEAYRTLKKGGYIFVMVPAYMALWNSHDIINYHRRRYNAKTMVELIDTQGHISLITYWNFFLFFPSAIMKLWGKIFNSEKLESDMKKLPPLINSIFLYILKIENKLIKAGLSLPFGTSIVICVKK